MNNKLIDNQYLLKMVDIKKKFLGVTALKGVDLTLKEGEVLALVGQNGAGKSTLIKILTGVYLPDHGDVYFYNEKINLFDKRYRKILSIGVVFQELSLFQELTVMENIFITNEFRNRIPFFIDWKKMRQKCLEILSELNIEVNPEEKIRNLGIGIQQTIEIAKSISHNIRILILDEPTSALSEKEVDKLFQLIRRLKDKGVGIIYISHRMKEIFQIADRVQVLRDGQTVRNAPINEIGFNDVIKDITGKKISIKRKIGKIRNDANIILKVRNLEVTNFFNNLEFDLREGEVLGIAGLLGSGRTEILKSILGTKADAKGTILLNGENIENFSITKRIMKGISFVPENRKEEGILPQRNIKENLTLSSLFQVSKFNFIISRKIFNIINELISSLRIVPPNPNNIISNLSGGNQQKVVLGRGLGARPSVLLLDEATRGIDVGAKYEIFELIKNVAEEGIAVIFVSLELQDLLQVCHRILVIRNGIFVRELKNTKKLSTEEITLYVTGVE